MTKTSFLILFLFIVVDGFAQRNYALFGSSYCDTVVVNFCKKVDYALNHEHILNDTVFYIHHDQCSTIEYAIDFQNETLEAVLKWDGEIYFRFKTVGKYFLGEFHGTTFIGEYNYKKKEILSLDGFYSHEYDLDQKDDYARNGIKGAGYKNNKEKKKMEKDYIEYISNYILFPYY